MAEPKYRQVKRELSRELARLPLGRPIPTERELAELTTEGWILRVHGKGTFVARPRDVDRIPLSISSYTEYMRGNGRAPSSRLLEVASVPANAEVGCRLGVAVGSRVLRVRRLRLADGAPVMVETTNISLVRFPGLRRYITQVASLHQVLACRFGVELPSSERYLETVLAGPEETDLLDARAGAPMLLVHRQSFDSHRNPVEWACSIMRGDRYKLSFTVQP